MKIADHMTYIVVCSHKGGSYIAERDVADTDRKTTVDDIASGELSNVIQIIEFNPVEGICRDVTDDIMSEAFDSGEPGMTDVDRQASGWDHARDLRKHEAA